MQALPEPVPAGQGVDHLKTARSPSQVGRGLLLRGSSGPNRCPLWFQDGDRTVNEPVECFLAQHAVNGQDDVPGYLDALILVVGSVLAVKGKRQAVLVEASGGPGSFAEVGAGLSGAAQKAVQLVVAERDGTQEVSGSVVPGGPTTGGAALLSQRHVQFELQIKVPAHVGISSASGGVCWEARRGAAVVTPFR